MLQPGIHKGIVEKHWFTTSQAGTPGLAIKVVIQDEWDSGQAFVGTIWLSEKAMGMARKQFRALGFDPDLNDLESIGDSISFIGNVVDVELKEEVYKGRTELRVASFGGQTPPPTKNALAEATRGLRAAKKKAEKETKTETTKNPFPDLNAQDQSPNDQFPWEVDDAKTGERTTHDFPTA